MKQRQAHTTVLKAVIFGALLTAAQLPASAAGDETETGWRIRFYAAAVDMDESPDGLSRPTAAGAGFDADVGGGFGVNAEYRFSRHLGVDLGLFTGGGVDLEATTYRTGETGWATYDTFGFTPLTLGLDIHLTPDSRIDFYACPMVALIHYSQLTVRSGPTEPRVGIDFDEELALGAGLGLGVPLGNNRWSFQANLTYLDASLEGNGANGVRISGSSDSTIFGLGFGYRFKPRSG